MSTLTIPSLSREFIRVPIEAFEGGGLVDPTNGTVQFAFKASGVEPTEPDWQDGQWEQANRTYFARVLVGAGGGVPVAEGTHDIWVRIANTPEEVARKVGQLVIT